MNLYELNSDINIIEKALEDWAIEHEGDITDFPLSDRLNELEGEKDESILNIGVWIKNLISDEKAISEEIKNLTHRKKVIKNKSERLKNYLQSSLEKGRKLTNSKCTIGWRSSTKVNLLVVPELLPNEYQKISITPNKTELKKFCQENKDNDLAVLETNQNITIK